MRNLRIDRGTDQYHKTKGTEQFFWRPKIRKKTKHAKNTKQGYRTRKHRKNRGTEHCSVPLVLAKGEYRTRKQGKNRVTEHP